MSDDFQEIAPPNADETEPHTELSPVLAKKQNSPTWQETLARLGFGEIVARVGTAILTVVLITSVAWMISSIFTSSFAKIKAKATGLSDTPSVDLASILPMKADTSSVSRLAEIHTIIPDRPRQDIIKYTIAKGDTVFDIAKKFNLKPQSIMFGNVYTLRDNPEQLTVGAELNILPVDGYYYMWSVGDGLHGVAKFLHVKPEDIISYPLNHLDPATIGDYSHPNIKPGTMLIIPGGTRPYNNTGGIQVGITRTNPAIARIAGSGACGKVYNGAVGLGTFIWPANKHYLSGFDYSPETNHRGIDIAGNTGEPVYAVDAGVIVYEGWNEFGYGNMIMIDHGNGWQSLYAHLSAINVICGGSVDQGAVIGAIGSTGNSSGSHLHFELMHTLYNKVNPWLYLPPP